MNDATTIMGQYQEDVENLEPDRRDRKEINGDKL